MPSTDQSSQATRFQSPPGQSNFQTSLPTVATVNPPFNQPQYVVLFLETMDRALRSRSWTLGAKDLSGRDIPGRLRKVNLGAGYRIP